MTNGQQTTQQTVTERVFHAVRQAILYIAIAGVAGAILGIVATEAIGAAVTHAAPAGPTHIAALVVGLLLGYAAAATAIIWALIVGLADAIRAIAGDLEHAGERVVHELETLAGARGQQSTTTVTSPVVTGTVVSGDPPAVRTGVMAGVASTPPVVVAAATPPATDSSHLSAPLVPTNQ